jgi:hypothetical protein
MMSLEEDIHVHVIVVLVHGHVETEIFDV